MASKYKVFVTRRLLAPAWELLSSNSSNLKLTVRDSDDVIPYKELVEGVVGVDALYCLVTDKVDRNVIEKAGPNLKVIYVHIQSGLLIVNNFTSA